MRETAPDATRGADVVETVDRAAETDLVLEPLGTGVKAA
jgi:hypothetical protein